MTVGCALSMLAALTACPSHTPQSHPSATTSATSSFVEPDAFVPPDPPDSPTPAAGVCPDLEGKTVTFTLAGDTPEPRCGRVRTTQYLRVTNATSASATIEFAREEYTIDRGSTITFSAPFGFVWQPGVHFLKASVYAGDGPEIWVSAPSVPASAPACEPKHLRLLLASRVSEATGQHTTELAVQNTSRVGCILNGYPGIEILNKHRRPLPFSYHDGGDQMLTNTAPKRVGLAAAGFAYFAINKYRCDLGARDEGT
jgi:hypothetical protein